jgi:tripartite-type tricarboxylate transporter receptor subunit TctC
LPEAKEYAPEVAVAESYEEFEKAVAAAIAQDSPERRQRRSDAMTGEDWTTKVAQTAAKVMEIKAEKCKAM